MKVSAAALALLAFAGSSSAQYFSAGWTPGQKPQDVAATPTATAFVPGATTTAKAKSSSFSFSDLLDINKILLSEPAVALFSKFGVNITDRVQAVIDTKLWDDRVPLITDDNFNDLIVSEPLTEEEEQERVWILVVTVTSVKQDGISKYLDNTFDAAFNQTQIAQDLPHVRWGRIDYLNVTAITTKWALWQAPYLVVLRERGQSLRFYRPHQIRLRDDSLREFLKVDGWKVTPPWSSAYAPGGSREWFMDFQAKYFTIAYNWVSIVPKWALLFLSGTVGSLAIGFLHRSPKATAPSSTTVKSAVTAPTSTTGKAAGTDSERESSAPAKRTSARQRKPARK